MNLHFAYGANMSRAVMRRHAPGAQPVGPAELAGHCFMITADGYGSIEPLPGSCVQGVLWRITPRDRVTLDAWENLGAGLYHAEMLVVRCASRRVPALVYRARPCAKGRPKPGYMALVIAAAREWDLPDAYIRSLERWSRSRPQGCGTRKLGEFS
jgi:hypothetical protein